MPKNSHVLFRFMCRQYESLVIAHKQPIDQRARHRPTKLDVGKLIQPIDERKGVDEAHDAKTSRTSNDGNRTPALN